MFDTAAEMCLSSRHFSSFPLRGICKLCEFPDFSLRPFTGWGLGCMGMGSELVSHSLGGSDAREHIPGTQILLQETNLSSVFPAGISQGVH